MSNLDEDVTDRVEFGEHEGDELSLLKCVCGTRFDPWRIYVFASRDFARACPRCGAKLYFENQIRVWKVTP